MDNQRRKREAVKAELHELKESAHDKREHLHEKAEQPIKVAGHPMTKADVYKFAGLIAFVVLVLAAIALVWPHVHALFEEGGLDLVIEQVKNAGPAGVLILLLMQFLQVVVAFIPGEITQVAAGMLYGPWWGALIILFGCVISSAFVYTVVHKLGAPFVRAMVPEKVACEVRQAREDRQAERHRVHPVLDSRPAEGHVHVPRSRSRACR